MILIIFLCLYFRTFSAEKFTFSYFRQSQEVKTGQILQYENSATGILCQLKTRHDTRASHLTFRKNVVGVVATTLGKEDD